jgi:mono/diheme cytochrome c family protein
MRTVAILYAALAIALPAQAAMPGDSAEGKKLHDANCVRCHDTSVYKSDKRQVKSLRALGDQLEECTHMAEAPLSDAQKKDVLKYLNEQFYKFK